MLFGAYPFAMGSRGTGWALIIFDRADALAQAHADAIQQLRVTGFHEHAMAAFDANAIAYLLKPIERERLRETVERAWRAGSCR
jgi:DNA-binding LytR/AlgR family response regulator